LVHALQGRSGLRPSLVQFFADCLNADVRFELPASDPAGIGAYFLAAARGGSQLPPALATELSAKGVAHRASGQEPLKLTNAEVGALQLGSAGLALAGGAALVLGGALEASGVADAVAVLSCAGAKGGVPLDLWAIDGERAGNVPLLCALSVCLLL
jgi:histidine ammonia-lyase